MRKKEAELGKRPLYREKNWNSVERKRKKKEKKYRWSSKGGCIAPIMIPSTPNGELARELRLIVEQEQREGIKLKIVETGGRTIKSQVQKSNPTATPGCSNGDCVACSEGKGKGGNCRKSNVQYCMCCKMCTEEDPTIYIGETARNLYTRTKEHIKNYKSNKGDSFILNHQVEKHGSLPADFSASVTNRFRDCLSRQVSEDVTIRRSGPNVLNSKSEWHQPALFRVQSEIVRG